MTVLPVQGRQRGRGDGGTGVRGVLGGTGGGVSYLSGRCDCAVTITIWPFIKDTCNLV